MMNKKIQLRVLDNKVYLISIPIIFLAIILMAKLAENIQNTSNQTMFIICFGSIITGAGYFWIKRMAKLFTFTFSSDSLIINSEEDKVYYIPYNQIKNYNIYYLVIKKMGFMIRIKSNKNHYYWICPKNFDNRQNSDDQDFIKIYKYFNMLLLNKKETYQDTFLKF
ncbi:hypothetical protein ETU08_02475 [Apibacter muscae]|uniref:hypothetical protein n=1 Tax=Apibacter muscae TaxID=2509004 RepID=UPI0011ABFA5A|nr:hypothetical protein [Apibacter muscae]TWP30888.1 hypothetical protein ETU08_02475 [Apibacter muscae]